MRYLAPSSTRSQRGFTLVELVIVIVIMGVIGGVVAVFMRSPIDAYFDSNRRAALTDVADTAVRRISRDVRKALPNSVRTPNLQCLEFIPTRTGGRYRTTDAAAGTSLDFTIPDTTFNMLGQNSLLPADQQILVGDTIVVYNLGPGIAGSDAYLGGNTATVTGVVDGTETAIAITPRMFPLSRAPGVSMSFRRENRLWPMCTGGNLRRTVTTGSFASNCPSNGPVLATNVQSCSFVYNGSDLQRNGLVQIQLNISSNNEAMSLYHEVHVNNSP